MEWFEEELTIAKPRIIVTLGSEVAGILQGVRGRKGRNELLRGDVKEVRVGDKVYAVIHLAHPGIIMRPATERNRWPLVHREEHIPQAREAIEKIL
jgi:uracil-DNA glycosylase